MEMTPLGIAADIVMGQSPDSKFYSAEEVGLPFLQGCAEFGNRFPRHKLFCSQNRKLASAGSILFSVRAPVGKLNIADRDYIIGRGLASISGTVVATRYLEHFLQFAEKRLRIASQGSTFEAINSTELAQWPVVHPKNQYEQIKIAKILSTVDQAIEQTGALIAKQQRIKTGLMQDLVTCGIGKYGNHRSEATLGYKDSSLGELGLMVKPTPQGWARKTLRDLATINYGKSPKGILSDDGLYPVVGTGGTERFSDQFLYDGESIILGRKGTIDRVHFVSGRFWTIDTAYYLSHFKDIQPRWLFYFLQNLDLLKLNEATGVPSLSRDLLYKINVETPPRAEQNKIAEILSRVDQAIDQAKALMDKQRFFKYALLQDLLTDKVSVKHLLTEAEISI